VGFPQNWKALIKLPRSFNNPSWPCPAPWLGLKGYLSDFDIQVSGERESFFASERLALMPAKLAKEGGSRMGRL
jgi:hypothetical protein